jgi:drug/metabolite transporter (DMT)-like permease
VGAGGVAGVGGGTSAAGILLALGALACEACFSLLAVPFLGRLGPLGVSTYACILAVPMLAGWSLVVDGPIVPAMTTDEAAALVYMAVVVTAGGFLLWYSAITLLGVERAGLFSGVLPVSALMCSAVIGATDITAGRLLAVGLVAGGITLGITAGRGTRMPPPGAPHRHFSG